MALGSSASPLTGCGVTERSLKTVSSAFPLLADFEPKGAVAKRYGVYREQDGTTERALFVIDADGVIRWRYVSPIDVNPGADGILEALDALTAEAAT